MNRTSLLVGCAAMVSLMAGPAGRSAAVSIDPIGEWSVAASSAAASTAMSPLRTPITLAMLHVAMDDAVTAANHPDATARRLRGAGSVSAYAAAVEAGYRVLLAEFPSQVEPLRTAYERLLAAEPDSERRRAGITTGALAATRLLAARANDGRNAVISYSPTSGPGAWVETPPAHLPATTAFLARVTPFTMDSPSQFRPSSPPALRSRQWVADVNEVKSLGAKDGSTRTPEQTATALFWEPLAGTVWVPTIRRLAREQPLDLASSARFHAAAFAAFADGLIACWDAKFHFGFWRPVTAIQHDGDGNALTTASVTWEPFATTPNFPEYPSGHTCVTAAVAHTIEDFFPHGTDIPARNVVTGEERVYRRAADVVDEVIEARMLLGLHFRTGDEDGAEMGRRIARQIRRTWLKRTS